MCATKKEFIIVPDEGTTNAKTVALDVQGNMVTEFSQPLAIQTPRDDWVEQSGEVLIDASIGVTAKAVSHVGAENVTALAISNQRETAIDWYRQAGRSLNSTITWQCARSVAYYEELRHENKEQLIKPATGLPIAPLFSASKMRWLLESATDGLQLAAQGQICLGTIDSWLLQNSTVGEAFCCDYSNAAHTQLLNLHSGEWDEAMLAPFHISHAALPEIKPSSGLFSHTRGPNGIPDGIPVMSMMGDSHAALFGHALGEMGCVKAIYGTGSSVMVPVKSAQCDIDALTTTIAWHDGNSIIHGLEGNILHMGDAVARMADSMDLNELSDAELTYELNTLPASVDLTLGVYFVPALTGFDTPWQDDSARGVICGLSRGVKRAHLIRATLESITYRIADVVAAVQQHDGFKLTALVVDGDPTRDGWLMQYQADLFGYLVMRSDVPEFSAIGAVLLARKALYPGSLTDLKTFLTVHSTFQPDMDHHHRLQKRWQEWRHAVNRTSWKPAPSA